MKRTTFKPAAGAVIGYRSNGTPIRLAGGGAPTVLEQLVEQRKATQDKMDAILATAEGENRSATDEEFTSFEEKRASLTDIDARIESLSAAEKSKRAAADAIAPVSRAAGGARVLSEPTTYGKGQRQSYFLDLGRAQLRGDDQAAARLSRHAQELDVLMPARENQRSERAARQLEGLDNETRASHVDRRAESFFEKESRVNPNRTDGQGGYFVPPLWLIDEYIALVRAGRPYANSIRSFDLPSGTDSINLPKVATGTSVAAQTADAAAVASVDLTDTFVNAPVRTLAGQQDIAIQLLDQSPIAFDEIIMADLLADYNLKLDTQLLQGSGATGQLKGLDNISGFNAVTYTDATPTGPELYAPLAQALSQVAKNRKLPALAFFCTAQRWYWLASQLDSQNRPLVVPTQAQEFNPLALQMGLTAEGPIGWVLGAPVIIDQAITVVDGAGTNQDRIYGVRTSDQYLWEGAPRTRVMQEVLSGTLQVRVQLYNYVAAMQDRYPAATSIITGTGLIVPAGF